MLLLFFLTLVVRRRWVGASIVAMLFAVGGGLLSSDALGGMLSGITVAILLAVLMRFGLVALVVAVLATNTLGEYPLTFDGSQWFAAGSYLTLGVLVTLAGLGAWTCANLRSVVPRWLSEAD